MLMTLQPSTRRLSSCYRHPAEPVTGFCASCLRERLAGIHPSSPPETTNATALTNSGGGRADRAPPELRRSKSVAEDKCEPPSGSSEPRRKSCEARVPKSLLNLFILDDKSKNLKSEPEVESKNLGFSTLTGPELELVGEDENEERIRVSEDAEEELKTVKELIDLECQRKKQIDLRDIAGSFRAAASVFSKKLRKWKRKQNQKLKNHSAGDRGGDLVAMRVENPNLWQLRESQSEVGDYRFGRRSCDVDPRFSVDDPRFSFDEHRASWDGYLIARTIPRLTPMLSVVESALMAPVTRAETRRCLVEEQMMNSIHEDENTSGGSAQTRGDYYWDSSSSQRRSSFDGSTSMKSSNKKNVALEVDENHETMKPKLSPATIDMFHGTKLLITEREMGNLSSNSFKDDPLNSKKANGSSKGVKKNTSWRKVWNFLGSREGLNDHKNGDVRENVIDGQLGNGEADGGDNGVRCEKLTRSSSCVNSRSSDKMVESNRSVSETRGCATKSKEARYSPSNFDNGLLRFYLTPSRSYKSKSGKSRLKNSQSMGSRVSRLNCIDGAKGCSGEV